MEQSESVANLSAALVAFQGEVCGTPKGGQNPHLRNHYTRLEDAIKATQDARLRHGLAVNQYLTDAPDGFVAVRTRLRHSSGEWEDGTFRMPIASGRGTTPAQQAGSAISYARRYAYLAVLGLAPMDDDAEGTRGSSRPDPDSPLEKARAALRQVKDTAEMENWKTNHGARLDPADKHRLASDYAAAMKRVDS